MRSGGLASDSSGSSEDATEEDEGQGVAPWSATVIIDSNYIPVLECWLRAFKRSGSRTRVRVVGLDGGVSKALRSNPGFAQLDNASEPLLQFVDLQPHPGLSLLQSGISPESFLKIFWRTMRESVISSPGGSIHNDADALWVQSPDRMLRHALRHHPDADIVTQVSYGAYWHPAFTQWGFVLNTGFTLFRNTTGVVAMIDSFMAENQTHFEQGVLNTYLLGRGCQWNQTHTKYSKLLTVGRCGNLKVLLLPQTQVDRFWKSEQGRLTVFHPDLRQTPLASLQDMGLC